MTDELPHEQLITTAYWSFGNGGLLDGRPIEAVSHLIAYRPGLGTPGPTLCGIDRFAKNGPGGGWHTTARNPYGQQTPVCPVCVDELRRRIRTEGS